MNKFKNYSKCLAWSTVFLLSAAAVGCGGGGGGGRDPILGTGVATFGIPAGAILPGAACSSASATIPAVTASDPTSGNQSVATSTTNVAGNGKLITATFNIPMLATSINATSFAVAPAGGAALTPASVSYNASTKVATLTTSSALLTNTTYNVVMLPPITSAAGTPMGCSYGWSFKTAAVASASPPPVNLGLAATYGIASAAGVSNVGASTINGDAVLAAPTSTCNAVAAPGGAGTAGFGACGGNPPTINGTVVTQTSPDNTTSAAVMADLQSAYNSIMAANLPGGTVLGCGVIGTTGGGGAGVGCAGNATLPPGVYMSATSSSIGVSGVLTLDGQGDANARFVFQMPSSTLTTAAGGSTLAPNSKITLINGAKAANVFWQVGSSATIGSFSQFQGNVLADASITMQTSATSCGRLLAGAITATGAFVFDTNTVSVPGNTNAPLCQ